MKERQTYLTKGKDLIRVFLYKSLPKSYWSIIGKLPFEERKGIERKEVYIYEVVREGENTTSQYFETNNINEAVEKYTNFIKLKESEGWFNATPNLKSFK